MPPTIRHGPSFHHYSIASVRNGMRRLAAFATATALRHFVGALRQNVAALSQ
ncbi:hypothetical protein COLSTE_02282 [Collinsella stercoris DSM 13279]|uniref:Uncharacterized protein n=1 Tax=Collinsella stercoris DSM 13279 TaxID=445975 RepID=B6GDU7_9ACTN|nr:hypothetical protein COLSTE_02282 [Collinsella stercoris DSM 13279]